MHKELLTAEKVIHPQLCILCYQKINLPNIGCLPGHAFKSCTHLSYQFGKNDHYHFPYIYTMYCNKIL